MAFFIWDNNSTAIQMIASVFTKFNMGEVLNNILNLGLEVADWIILLISTVILFIFDGNKHNLKEKKINDETKFTLICILAIFILVFGIYGIGFDVNEFIYSKF